MNPSRHVEPVEPRRLFAGGPDPAFGTAGRVALSDDYPVNGVFATHGAIYVDADLRGPGGRTIFKYTDAGKLDTTWGDGGKIEPRIFPDPSSTDASLGQVLFAYDVRTGGLLIGFAEGSVVTVERRTATGALDTAWGGGRVEFSERRTALGLAAIVPRAGKKVLLAVDREQQRGEPYGGRPRPGGRSDVLLVRFDRLGRRDRAFNGGRPVTVADGFVNSVTTARGSVYDTKRSFSDPTFGDLRARPDGGVRVVLTRVTARARVVYTEANETFDINSRFTTEAESVVVSDSGVVQGGLSKTYHLLRGTSSGGNGTPDSGLEPERAVAIGDDGVAVLADLRTGGVVFRLSPTARPPVERVELPKDDRRIFNTARGPGGQVLVQSEGSGDYYEHAIVRLRADLSPDRTFADRGVFRDVGPSPFLNFAADDGGRLVVAENGELTRYA